MALLREEAAVGEAGTPAATPDPHAVGVALLNLLRLVADDGPLLVAVDDVQWLDSASAQALGFSLRRLGDEPVGFLLARRIGDDAGRRSRDLPIATGEVERLAIAPLDTASIGRLIEARTGRALAHPTVVRIHAASAGNPFFALELARARAGR